MAARSLLFLPFSWLFVRDVVPMEVTIARAFAEERDIEVHPVDPHPIQLLSDGKWGWWVANWAVLAPLLWYRPFAVGMTIAALLGPYVAVALLARWNRTVAWFVNLPLRWGVLMLVVTRVSFSPLAVLLPLLFFLVAVPRTIQTRNEVMLTNAEEIAEREGVRLGVSDNRQSTSPGNGRHRGTPRHHGSTDASVEMAQARRGGGGPRTERGKRREQQHRDAATGANAPILLDRPPSTGRSASLSRRWRCCCSWR